MELSIDLLAKKVRALLKRDAESLTEVVAKEINMVRGLLKGDGESLTEVVA